MRILVAGAAGQLGAVIVREFERDHEVLARTHWQLDLTDDRAVADEVNRSRPEVIINCAAYNDVDGAEDEPVAALNVNAFAVRALARAAKEHDAILVHYSTDFVFDGTANVPYEEEHQPNPRSFYAASKLLGEWFAADAPRRYVLRVESLFGGPAARSTFDKIADAILDDREARVFVDRTVSPSYVVDVATATRALIERKAPYRLYHCVNSGMATWHEVAKEIARLLDRKAQLTPVSMVEVALRAQRPQFCALSNAKLLQAGVRMPEWQDALARYLTVRQTRGQMTAG